MDFNELLKQYAIGERDFRSQDLHELKLVNSN